MRETAKEYDSCECVTPTDRQKEEFFKILKARQEQEQIEDKISCLYTGFVVIFSLIAAWLFRTEVALIVISFLWGSIGPILHFFEQSTRSYVEKERNIKLRSDRNILVDDILFLNPDHYKPNLHGGMDWAGSLQDNEIVGVSFRINPKTYFGEATGKDLINAKVYTERYLPVRCHAKGDHL